MSDRNKNDDFMSDVFDKALEYASDDMLEELYEEFSCDDDQIEPSENLDNRMQELISEMSKQEKGGRRKYALIKRVRYIAASMVLLIGISAAVIVNVDAFRVPVLNFFLSLSGTKQAITIDGVNQDENILLEYGYLVPKYIPEGFSWSEIVDTNEGVRISYVNEFGKAIYYELYEDLDTQFIEYNTTERENILINGQICYQFISEDHCALYCQIEESYCVLLSDIDKEELVKMMESIIEL